MSVTMNRLLWLVLACVLSVGCREKELSLNESSVRIKGIVTLDGQPLPDGRFVVVDEQRDPRREYLAAITNGKFEIEVPPGERRVEIRSYQEPENPSLEAGEYPQILPARYNDDSELTINATAGMVDAVRFELTSETD